MPYDGLENSYYSVFVETDLKALAVKTKELVFKGGTSLTKCYQLLDRFS